MRQEWRILPHNSPFFDPLDFFVGRLAIVDASEGVRIVGTLLAFQVESEGRKPHRPSLLILENQCAGKVIVRGWQSVGTLPR